MRSAMEAVEVLSRTRLAHSRPGALQHSRLGACAYGRLCPVHVWPVLKCPPRRRLSLCPPWPPRCESASLVVEEQKLKVANPDAWILTYKREMIVARGRRHIAPQFIEGVGTLAEGTMSRAPFNTDTVDRRALAKMIANVHSSKAARTFRAINSSWRGIAFASTRPARAAVAGSATAVPS
jgi:hypothetical protein